MLSRLLCSLLLLVNLCPSVFAWTHGLPSAVQANANSPLGIHLTQVGPNSSEQPFTNVFLNNGGWITQVQGGTFDTGDEANLCLDSEGWPVSVTQVLSAGTGSPCTTTPVSGMNAVTETFYNSLPSPYFTTGTYDVYYTGTCALVYQGSAVGTTTNTGHDQFTVSSPTSTGIFIQFTATAAAPNNCKITSVTLSTQTAAYQAGCINGLGNACWNPQFLSYLSKFRTLRFMDWMCNVGQNNGPNIQTTYSTRPTIGIPSYGNTGAVQFPCGVPVEVMVDLANQGNWDVWFNMPVQATNGPNSYVQQFASYVLAHLNSTSQVYLEYSNETWNYGAASAGTINTLATAFFGSGSCPSVSEPYDCNRAYAGMETARMCEDWRTIWGASFSTRVHCSMGAQAVDTGSATGPFVCDLWSGAAFAGSGSGTNFTTTGVTGTIWPGNALPAGSGVPAGTYIVSQTSGTTGGAGVYVTNQATTASSVSMTVPQCGTYGAGGSSPYGITAIDIAPYFGTDAGSSTAMPTCLDASWLSQGDGGLTSLFTAIDTGGNLSGFACEQPGDESFLAFAESNLTSYTAAFPTYEMLAYESGQTFLSDQWSAWTSLFTTANADSRMGTAYANYYASWKANGGHLMIVFADIGSYSQYGSWGQEQSLCGDGAGCNTTPYTYTNPKYVEDLSFIAANPCTSYSGWTFGCH